MRLKTPPRAPNFTPRASPVHRPPGEPIALSNASFAPHQYSLPPAIVWVRRDLRLFLLDRRAVLMELPDGESWEFETDGPEIVLEESILLSDNRGNRATEQIVMYGRVQQTPSVHWHLHRTALGRRPQQLLTAGEPVLSPA